MCHDASKRTSFVMLPFALDSINNLMEHRECKTVYNPFPTVKKNVIFLF